MEKKQKVKRVERKNRKEERVDAILNLSNKRCFNQIQIKRII